MKKQSGMRLRVMVMVLFAGVFVFGAASGAFIYATGNAVTQEVFMKMISHTEYRYGESGQIVTRLVNFKGDPVAVDNCTARILYPDKTIFVSAGLMSSTGNIAGDHYYNFTTPNGPEGVYEYQATCFYTVGANQRNASVTNSFHLSGAFNAVLGNLTNVQNNLTQLSLDLVAVNSSLSGDIADLSDQLNVNITAVLAGQADLEAQINSNVTQILDAISNISIEVNLTPVLDAIDSLETSMAANFTAVFGEFSVVNSKLDVINVTVTDIQGTVNDMELVLDNVNTTTTNTYNYVTGTLATNVNSILSQLGVINATVNRIETNTLQINSTVADILQNQEDEVVMTVFSG